MGKRKDVSAAEVRTWAKGQDSLKGEACLGDKARGRLSPAVIEAFNKAHPTKRYGKVAKTVTLPVPREDAKGRIAVHKTAIDHATAAQARDLVGLGKRGRLSPEGAATLGAAFADLKG